MLALPSVAAVESGFEEPRADSPFNHRRGASVRVRKGLRVKDEALSAQNDGAHQGSLPLSAMRAKLHSQERPSEARHEDSQREDSLRRMRQDFRARHVHEQTYEDARPCAIPVQCGGLRQDIPRQVSINLPPRDPAYGERSRRLSDLQRAIQFSSQPQPPHEAAAQRCSGPVPSARLLPLVGEKGLLVGSLQVAQGYR